MRVATIAALVAKNPSPSVSRSPRDQRPPERGASKSEVLNAVVKASLDGILRLVSAFG